MKENIIIRNEEKKDVPSGQHSRKPKRKMLPVRTVHTD